MKVAFFVEGQTEAIFVEALLKHLFGAGRVEVKVANHASIYTFWNVQPTYALHTCLVYDCEGDEQVVSKIKENYTRMKLKGFEAFFGLRDVHSQRYEKVGERLIHGIRSTIKDITEDVPIGMHFARMETETWFLACPSFLEKLNPELTLNTIKKSLKKDLNKIELEALDHPVNFLKRIYKLVNLQYGKSKDDAHAIVSRLDFDQLCLETQHKIPAFHEFLDDIEGVMA